MKKKPKTITILGSTGSIGQNTVELVANSTEIEIVALTANNNIELLIEQAKLLKPKYVAIRNESLYFDLKRRLAGYNIEIGAGESAIIEAAKMQSDVTIVAIVGIAALLPTMEAIKRGTRIGLASKECLVCAGELMTEAALKYNSKIIPVDSEHSAIFQVFDFERPHNVDKIILTASGGAFRNLSKEQMSDVTVDDALKHPTWQMGQKITIDCATLINKGLELIEAYYLFPVNKEQIDVVIHPESIIHSFVNYIDGSMLAQMSIPDMKIPISYALTWPERKALETKKIDFSKLASLTFQMPCLEKFPALKIAKQALMEGSAAQIILNAANEIAVDAFINKKIKFLDIVDIINDALNKITSSKIDSIEEVINLDKEVRIYSLEIIKNKSCQVVAA